MSAETQEHPSDAANEADDTSHDQLECEEFQRPYDHNDLCDSNPDFPIICSFISRFGSVIDLQLNIEWLEESIENQESLDDGLIEIHVKLLRKLRRYINPHQWEKALVRFAYEYSNEDGYELESLGYLKTRPSIKLGLLRRLLEAQSECDAKFKTSINAIEANELRNQPTGRDIKGNTYWHQVDDEGSLRVYRDEPLDYTAWKTVCRNPADLKSLLEELEQVKEQKIKGEPHHEPYNPHPKIFPELFREQAIPSVEQPKPEKTSHKKPNKKGRGRNRKSSPLQTLKEIDENTIVDDCSINVKPNVHEIPLSKDNRPRSISPNGSTSVESQVKYTIENILNRVTSSFDYIFRRNSPDSAIQPPSIRAEDKKLVKPKKKRECRPAPELPRRTSSRIQQLQQKKVQEEEENLKRKQVEAAKLLIQQVDNASKDSTTSEKPKKLKLNNKKDKQRWRNNKGKQRLSWDKDDSDLSSTSSLTDSNDDESFIQAIDERDNDENDDDEFACEEEETNDAPVVLKRARTARQSLGADEAGDLNNSTMIEEDKPCGRCDKSNDPESILLCDMCDDGYHTVCCTPPLMYVPDGDWFCPTCEHKTLIQKLTDILISVEAVLTIKEREYAKRQKLRQTKKDPVNPKTEELTSGRKRDKFLCELNEPLAIRALDEEATTSPDEALSPSYKERAYRRPKKARRTKQTKRKSRRYSESDDDEWNRRSKKTYSRSNSDSESEVEDFTETSEAYEESEDSEKPKTRRARACVSYKFDEYDELIQSAIWADSDKIDAGLTDHDDDDDEGETCNVGRGKDMATIEALAYQQENGLEITSAPAAGQIADSGEAKKPAKQRKRGRKLNDLDAESEIDIATSDESFQASSATEEEDEDEDDDVTEVTSDESSIDEIVDVGGRHRCKNNRKKKRRYSTCSEDSDFLPRTRRAAAKQVSYKESTDEEDEPSSPYPPISLSTKNIEDDPHNPYPQIPAPAKNMTPQPPHPPFYDDDEVNPSTSNPSGNQRSW